MPNPTLNRRYRKLIEQLDKVDLPTREIFLYLFAMVAAGQGIVNVVRTQEERGRRIIVMNDPLKQQEFKVMYPEALDPEYAHLAVAEMERLLSDESLGSSMDSTLFEKLYHRYNCRRCRYLDRQFWQFCAECRFAGYPVNFEKREDR